MQDRPGASLDMTESGGFSAARAMKPYLMVHFACAGVYQRVYRSADGTRYLARCAKCGRAVPFKVGAGGTDRRRFVVNCSA